jgi:hypothetical protein
MHALLPRFFPFVEEHVAWLKGVLSVVALTLPAVASALAGISVFGNYGRNAERYESMSHHLLEISDSLCDRTPPGAAHHAASPFSRLQRLIREADRAMAHEHRGWRAVFGVRLPGPG